MFTVSVKMQNLRSAYINTIYMNFDFNSDLIVSFYRCYICNKKYCSLQSLRKHHQNVHMKLITPTNELKNIRNLPAMGSMDQNVDATERELANDRFPHMESYGYNNDDVKRPMQTITAEA